MGVRVDQSGQKAFRPSRRSREYPTGASDLRPDEPLPARTQTSDRGRDVATIEDANRRDREIVGTELRDSVNSQNAGDSRDNSSGKSDQTESGNHAKPAHTTIYERLNARIADAIDFLPYQTIYRLPSTLTGWHIGEVCAPHSQDRTFGKLARSVYLRLLPRQPTGKCAVRKGTGWRTTPGCRGRARQRSRYAVRRSP